MNNLSRALELYLFKIVIMLPSLFLLFYIMPYIYSYLDYYLLIPIAVLPLTRLFLKKKMFSYVYPVFTLIFLLIMLYTLLYDFGIFQNRILNHILISFDFRTLSSIMIALGVVILEEGIFTEKIYRVVGSVVFSNLFLLEQYAAIYLMNNPGAVPLLGGEKLTYFQSFSAVVYLEMLSIYSFVVNGYEYMLPLATFRLPYEGVILGLFLVSIVALLLYLYRSDTRWISERGITLGYAVIAGSIIGALGIFLVDSLNSYYFGSGFLLFFVVGVTLYAIHTSRNAYNERVE